MRDDVIDEVRRGLDHAPGAAGGAEIAMFAGESYQMLTAAAVAFDADEAVFEQAAAQIVAELPGDERWQGRLPVREVIAELRKTLLDDRVERRLLWLMPLVVRMGISVARHSRSMACARG
jgi:hypothetical protein